MNQISSIAKESNRPMRPSGGVRRFRETLARAFSAFTTGARLIPLGDNGRLLASLAAKSTDR